MNSNISNEYDIVIIGGGPAGMAAAIEAKKQGIDKILIIERNERLGGILLQCIHNGFGTVIFKKDLPGPLYAYNFIQEIENLNIEYITNSMVLEITPLKKVYVSSPIYGYLEIQSKSIILAMGCRERTRAQLAIPGSRGSGIWTAGAIQRMVNIEGYMPCKKVVILGSGDIGMIMARRLTLEGAKVERVVEIMPHLTGLRRNYVQCLQDFNIPLQLNHTVKRIIGRLRVEAVEIVKVDDNKNPIPDTEEIIPCDTLILSVGLIPENELSRKMGIKIDPITNGPFVDENMETNIPGVFAAGNVVHIYDLVDYVTLAGYKAGKAASDYVKGINKKLNKLIRVIPGKNVRSVIPHFIKLDYLNENIKFEIRSLINVENKINITISYKNFIIQKNTRNYIRSSEMIDIELPIKKIKSFSETQKEKVDSLTININETS